MKKSNKAPVKDKLDLEAIKEKVKKAKNKKLGAPALASSTAPPVGHSKISRTFSS
ncbi:hypothetical protein HF521_007486 [Silurus meridionalis]|uniref:Uncharacterized protein n=2 Tax=Silurus meridionalis TaxID=175797 RepID=A0A8T0AP33_SILME|nr:hypothetical protein HF521_007486 [Silurus meridionalis]